MRHPSSTVIAAVVSLGTGALIARAQRTASRAADDRHEAARTRNDVMFGDLSRDTRLEHQERADVGVSVGWPALAAELP